MRFESLSLENFKSYEQTDITFEPGVTVIHGVNGSGKSTLLEACFFALYGSDALVGTLDEVVTTGEEKAAVSLQITHDGQPYEVTRDIRVRGDRAHTAACELETPADALSGARAVRAEIANLLRMDADAFLNCAYVRQGEVNKLIHAAPRERQDMIDELLQLGILETYRDRATHARRGIASLRDEYAGQLGAIDDQITRKEGRNLTERLNTLETERNELDDELEQLDEQMAVAEKTRSEAETTLEQFEERREEVAQLDDDIAEIEDGISATEREREECSEQIASRSEDLADVRDQIATAHADLDIDADDREAVDDLWTELQSEDEELREEIEEIRIDLHRHEQSAEQADERAVEQGAIADKREKEVAERQDQIASDEAAVSERHERLETLREERADHTEAITNAGFDAAEEAIEALEECQRTLTDLGERESELEARIETQRDAIAEMEALIDAGHCPTCEQPVMGAPAVEAIDDERSRLSDLEESIEAVRNERERAETDRERIQAVVEHAEAIERLDDRIQSAVELLEAEQERLEERRDAVASLVGEVEQARTNVEEAKERATAEREVATALRKRIAEVNAARESVRTRRESVDALRSLYETRSSLEETIESLRERRENLEALNAERRDRLTEKRERQRDLQERVDENRIQEAQRALKKATTYLEQAEDRRESLSADRDSVIDQLGAIQSELADLRSLREQHDQLAESHASIDALHTEVETLETLYADLRRDLRERNVMALERMLNETFELLYQNDAYERIDLDRDYRFTVYQKDGSSLDPSLLSGGERALFNLSLRCAIYRLLSEGIEGTAPLPPLILDEPTVYLDSGHVGRLVELVNAMRSLGVEQIVLVSHDDELLRAADVVFTVEKDPTTNRSHVSTQPTAPQLPVQD